MIMERNSRTMNCFNSIHTDTLIVSLNVKNKALCFLPTAFHTCLSSIKLWNQTLWKG